MQCDSFNCHLKIHRTITQPLWIATSEVYYLGQYRSATIVDFGRNIFLIGWIGVTDDGEHKRIISAAAVA